MGAERLMSVVVVVANVLLVVVVVVLADELVVRSGGAVVAAGVVVAKALLWTQRPSLVAHVPWVHLQCPPSNTVGPSQAAQEVLLLVTDES